MEKESEHEKTSRQKIVQETNLRQIQSQVYKLHGKRSKMDNQTVKKKKKKRPTSVTNKKTLKKTTRISKADLDEERKHKRDTHLCDRSHSNHISNRYNFKFIKKLNEEGATSHSQKTSSFWIWGPAGSVSTRLSMSFSTVVREGALRDSLCCTCVSVIVSTIAGVSQVSLCFVSDRIGLWTQWD